MPHRPLNVIAAEIRQDWGTRINGAAAPFVEGLSEVRTARDRWYAETGADFLSSGMLTHSAPAANLSLLVDSIEGT